MARDDWDEFYAREVAPALAAREARRRDAVRFHHRVIAGGAAAAVGVLLVGSVLGGSNEVFLILGGVVLLGAVGWGRTRLDRVSTDVKHALAQTVAPFAGVTFTPEVVDPPAFEVFRRRKLVPDADRSRFEDLLEGERDGIGFQLYEAHLERVRTDHKGRRRTVTVFRGQLVRMAFPRAFDGVTLVLRDHGLFNALNRPGDGLKRVGLVDPTFEKTFEVYGSDQVEARYLVTPTFMERLLELEQEMRGQKVRAAFEGGDVLVAVEGGDLFESGSMFEPLATPERARRLLDEIAIVHNMIDALLERPGTDEKPAAL